VEARRAVSAAPQSLNSPGLIAGTSSGTESTASWEHATRILRRRYSGVLEASATVEITRALGLGIPALVNEGIHWTELPGVALAAAPSQLGSEGTVLGSADRPAAPVG
jgi:hypothetical protein